MSKKVSFSAKPRAKPFDPDKWVQNLNQGTDQPTAPPAPQEQMKRLTIDVPLSLHKRIKSQCAAADQIMADEIRALLEKRFPAPEEKGATS